MGRQKVLKALIFKVPPTDGDGPIFKEVDEEEVKFWRRFGWILLVTEREIRYADIDDVRKEDERGGRAD